MREYTRDPFAGYDAWLERPYQDQYEAYACPECGEDSLTVEGYSVACMECNYVNEPDWDAIAEARAEQELDRESEDYYSD